MIFMTIVLMFPAEPDPTPQTMNYTVLVFGGVTLLASIYYWTSGVHWFKGPIITVETKLGATASGADSPVENEKEPVEA
jgi:hypothetical protein